MNIVCITGRTTADIDLRYTPSEMAVAKFTLAVDRRKKEDGADFIRCTAFGRTAEIIGQYVTKGTMIGVSGRIQTGSYENREGKKVFTFDVIVDSFDFLSSKTDKSKQNDYVKSLNDHNESDFGQAESADDFDKLFDDEQMPF